ncbi:MAG: phosphohistidine phosphatase SixA [Candidatus Saccharibacteria bacterium]|nr:phosphohistidine phosphatase SixA [Moraxellaceae bacterium]
MQLILMRHGEAEPYQANDAVRNLTTRGVAQAHLTAQQVLEKYQPDLLVASPYVRAQQTVGAFQQQLPNVQLHILDEITPDADPRIALDALTLQASQYSAQCIVVVCHMNVIAYIAGLLLDEDPEIFGLAEARVFEQPFILLGLSVETARFLPLVDTL